MGAEIIRENRFLEPTVSEQARASVQPELQREDAVEESSLRPKNLSEYLGQNSLKNVLEISLKAAQQRDEPLDHILLYGPPGLGKTSMAMVLASEMNCPFVLTSAPALERPRDIVGFLMTLEPNTIFFIDEIHRLNKVAEEILYSAMEDFILVRTVGKGPTAKSIEIPLPKFTLVGATTKAGSLSSPLRDRFGLVHRLNYYSPEELVLILQRNAELLNFNLDTDAAMVLAKRARGTPRIANRLLKRTRDFIEVKHPNAQSAMLEQVKEALDVFEIDAQGLDPTDRKLLQTLYHQFSGGPAGIETLAAAIGEDARTLEDIVEPYLMQVGLIQRTPRGRMLTPLALQTLFSETTSNFSFQNSLL